MTSVFAIPRIAGATLVSVALLLMVAFEYHEHVGAGGDCGR